MHKKAREKQIMTRNPEKPSLQTYYKASNSHGPGYAKTRKPRKYPDQKKHMCNVKPSSEYEQQPGAKCSSDRQNVSE